MGTHARYSPSSSHRWIKCFGCVALAETLPEPPPKQYTIEGTGAHWLGEQFLKKEYLDFETFPGRDQFIIFEQIELPRGGVDYVPFAIGKDEPESGPIVQITDEMLAGVKIYVDYVLEQLGDGDLYIEERVYLDDEIHGTADVIIDHPFDVLHVVDYKNGQTLVEVVENSQLEIYGLGAVAKFGDVYRRIDVTIVQPNAEHPDGPIRTWSIDPAELTDRGAKFIEARARCEAESETYLDGAWCHWCDGIRKCPKMHERTLEVAKNDFSDGPSAAAIIAREDVLIVKSEIEKLKTILDAEERIKDLLSEAKSYAIDLIQSGIEIEGYKVEPSLGNRAWKSEISGLINYLKRKKHKLDEYKPRTIISPAKMEKLINDKKRVAAFCDRPDRGFRLAKAKTNAPALASVQNDFDKIEAEEKKENV